MDRYSVDIVTEDIADDEPLKVIIDNNELPFSSLGYRTPSTFSWHLSEFDKKGKKFRKDLVMFRDDCANDVIFSLAMRINDWKGDSWWGILALSVKDDARQRWAAIGSKAYLAANDLDGLGRLLVRMAAEKRSNYSKYDKVKTPKA